MTLVKVRLSFKAFSAASFISSLLHLRQFFIYLKFTFIFIFFFWIVLVALLPFFISHLFYRFSLLILSYFLFIFLYLVNIFLALFGEQWADFLTEDTSKQEVKYLPKTFPTYFGGNI